MDLGKPTLINTLTALAFTAPEKSYIRAAIGDDYRSEMLWELFVMLREHNVREIIIDLRTLSLAWNYYAALPIVEHTIEGSPHYHNMKRIHNHCHERLTS